jgi:hypothetical protein
MRPDQRHPAAAARRCLNRLNLGRQVTPGARQHNSSAGGGGSSFTNSHLSHPAGRPNAVHRQRHFTANVMSTNQHPGCDLESIKLFWPVDVLDAGSGLPN